MSTSPNAKELTEQTALPAPRRSETVVMGRADFLSIILRLIGVELYKFRRRAMSKVITAIALPILILTFLVLTAFSFIYIYTPVESYLPPKCTETAIKEKQPCLDHLPTQDDLAHAAQSKSEAIQQGSTLLRLPASLAVVSQLLQSVGLIFSVIIAGTMTGGEYGVGTIRLMFTRGPTRTQFLLSKVGAMLAAIGLSVVLWVITGILLGTVLNLFVGIALNFTFLTGTWIVHTILYLVALVLDLFIYAMLALCLSTLGRSSAAGVAGALLWWILEGIIGPLFVYTGTVIKGVWGDILKAVPDYFIGVNTTTLLQNQDQYVVGGQPSFLSDLHAVLVLAVYLVVFIGLACWVNQQRDIT